MYSTGYWLSRSIARTVFALRVDGVQHVPATGAAILAPNHVSYLDPLLVGSAVSRPVHFMAKRELFETPVLGWLISRVNAYPVSRERVDPSTVKHTLALLAAGQAVTIFPEGTRGSGAGLGPVRPGIGVIAARSGAPVVPVYHAGTDQILPRGARRMRRVPIWVRFGPPLRLTVSGEPSRAELDGFGRRLLEALTALRELGQPDKRGIH